MADGDYKPRFLDAHLDELFDELPAIFVTGPRAAGKTTTLERRAATVARLDRPADAAPFRADPDVALRGLTEPVLLDEWQNVPEVLGAVRRAVDRDPRGGRYLVTGSVRAEADAAVWPATGRLVRLKLYPMTVREMLGRATGPTFFERVLGDDTPRVPRDTPDILGYLELAVTGGFPYPALQLGEGARERWLESYIEDALTRDIEQLERSRTKKRNREALRRYFEAYALNSAGLTDHKRIYEAAGIDFETALSYEGLLTDLFLVERLPAWTTNRLKRLTRSPKRYVVDPSLIAAQLRLDAEAILRDAGLCGRVVDTFVAAQLRPEAAASPSRPRLHHLRTEGGRHEIDLVAELSGTRVIAIEVKAGSAPSARDARHLVWLRDQLNDRFVRGVVFHTGPAAFELDERILALPISTLWAEAEP